MFTYNILDGLKVEITIQQNPYEIPLEDLFLMAARVNKKRSFLFVSKVLGKHLPIKPIVGMQVGFLLAARYMEVVKATPPRDSDRLISSFKNHTKGYMEAFIEEQHCPIVIGFAETATALGHAFFEAFRKADFFHTTREWFEGVEPTITFEEEHSHATSHRVYVEKELLESNREIILVDDEITTGKTALNIIRALHEKFPRKTYTVVSILDWRSHENEKRFKELEQELGITIHTVSLVKGTATEIGGIDMDEQVIQESIPEFSQHVSFHRIENPDLIKIGSSAKGGYTRYTGRFGLTSKENEEATNWMKKVGEDLAGLRTGKRSLVLGAGEFMYIPMKVSSYMGENVFYHSTTRSPIFPTQREKYGAKNRFSFLNPEDPSIQHYLYNISENQYDDIFIFFEKRVDKSQIQGMLEQLKRTYIPNIRVVYIE